MSGGKVQWCLVVPVKRLEGAKTRLGPPYDGHRVELALAFAVDTTLAALASPAVRCVVVVTDDVRAADVLAAVGAAVVADEPDAGINPALLHGARLAAAAHPDCGLGALSADLPALRPTELATVLGRAAASTSERSFVRVAEGRGTTAVLARSLEVFRPTFGADSALRHAEAGFAEVPGDDLPSVRLDVDTSSDLAHARVLGLGARTAEVLQRLG